MIAPLTDLLGEVAVSKTERKLGRNKRPWYWNNTHQEAFELIKQCLAREKFLAYPKYGEIFEIYTDASTRQLGAVITKNGRPLAFFSQKLNRPQQKYSITELELLSIVECLK